MIAFLNAVKKLFPDAWADDKGKSHALLQTSALQMILGILQTLFFDATFQKGFHTRQKPLSVSLPPSRTLPLLGNGDTLRLTMRLSTSGKRKMFIGQLKELLKLKPPGP